MIISLLWIEVGVSLIPDRKYQTCLIFTTLDWAAGGWTPAIANESEQASPTGRYVLL